LVQIEREEWRLVGLGRSCIVEGIDVEIGEVIVVVNYKEGCRESNVRIGWMIDNLVEVEVVGSCEEEIVPEVGYLEVQVDPVDIVVVVVAEELGQVEGEH